MNSIQKMRVAGGKDNVGRALMWAVLFLNT